MATFKVQGGLQLKGELHPQGQKNGVTSIMRRTTNQKGYYGKCS